MKIEEWLQKNSIKGNEQYYISVLRDHGFIADKDFKINPHCSGDCYIGLSYKLISYRVELDIKNKSFNLLEGNMMSFNPSRKERYRLIESFKDDIFEVLDFIKSTGYKLAS